MKLSEHSQFKCELYRRQLLQSGVDEMAANSQVSVLAQVFWTVEQARETRSRLRDRYMRSLNKVAGFAFACGVIVGWLVTWLLPTLWG